MLKRLIRNIFLSYQMWIRRKEYNAFLLDMADLTPSKMFSAIALTVAKLKVGEYPSDGRITPMFTTSEILSIPDFEQDPQIVSELYTALLCDYIVTHAKRHDVTCIVFYDKYALASVIRVMSDRGLETEVYHLAAEVFGTRPTVVPIEKRSPIPDTYIMA